MLVFSRVDSNLQKTRFCVYILSFKSNVVSPPATRPEPATLGACPYSRESVCSQVLVDPSSSSRNKTSDWLQKIAPVAYSSCSQNKTSNYNRSHLLHILLVLWIKTQTATDHICCTISNLTNSQLPASLVRQSRDFEERTRIRTRRGASGSYLLKMTFNFVK